MKEIGNTKLKGINIFCEGIALIIATDRNVYIATTQGNLKQPVLSLV